MDTVDWNQIRDWTERLSLITLLSGIIWAVLKGIWVPGSMYREVRAERDEARSLLATSVRSNDALTELLEKVTNNWRPQP